MKILSPCLPVYLSTCLPASLFTALRLPLLLLLLVYALLGGLYATQTPLWQVPDEPAHYNYVRAIVENQALPVLQAGDYDAAYLEQLKAEKFPPEKPIDGVRYEGWQPPLYYLLAAPVFALTQGQAVAVRLFSLALGAGGLLLVYGLTRTLWPAHPSLALAAAGFWAFLPQHLAMLAGVNNDALAEVVMLGGLYLTVRWWQSGDDQPRWLWALGGVVGAAFLTKLSIYPLVVIPGSAIVLRAYWQRWPRRRVGRALLHFLLPALVLGGLWWGRNLLTYGGLDFLGMQRHDAVVVGQLRTSEALAQWGWATYARRFVETTFQSYWGQFGWMGVVMDQRVYWVLQAYSLFLLVGLAGWAWHTWQHRTAQSLMLVNRGHSVALVLPVVLALAIYLYYNLTFVQFQGRYLYSALGSGALGAALAGRQWASWLAHWWRWSPARLEQLAWVVAGLMAGGQAALAGFALYRFILPALTR